MAKSAISIRATLASPFGEVAPTIARPGAPLSLSTAAKSLANWLAVKSSGSATIEKGFEFCNCGAGLAIGADGWDSCFGIIATFAGASRAV